MFSACGSFQKTGTWLKHIHLPLCTNKVTVCFIVGTVAGFHVSHLKGVALQEENPILQENYCNTLFILL